MSDKVKQALFSMLEAEGAKGKRKHVRGPGAGFALFNVREGGKQLTGKVLDVSVAGMACQFDDEMQSFKVCLRIHPLSTPAMGLQQALAFVHPQRLRVDVEHAGDHADHVKRLVLVTSHLH